MRVRSLALLGVVAGLVLMAGPARAQAQPSPKAQPSPGIPTPFLPPAIPGQAPVPTPAPVQVPAPVQTAPPTIPNPNIYDPANNPPTIGQGPDQFACTASWWNLYGQAVCATVKGAQSGMSGILSDLATTLHIPDPTTTAEFDRIFNLFRGVADAILLLLVVVGGIKTIAHEWTSEDLRSLLPRLFVAIAAVNFAVPALQLFIHTSNTLVSSILTVKPSDLVVHVAQPGLDQDLGLVILLVIILVVVVLLLVLNLLSWSLIGIGSVYGATVSALLVLEETAEISKRWWRGLAWLSLSPVLQAITLLVMVNNFITTSAGASGLVYDVAMRLGAFIVLLIIPIVCLKKALGTIRPSKGIAMAYTIRKLTMGI